MSAASGLAANVKRIIVTGANRGIGLEVVNQVLLREPNTFVVLTSRDAKRGQEAVRGLVAKNPSFQNRVEVVELEVTNDLSVARATVHLLSKFGAGSFYALVNNAAVLGASADTGEAQINTNVWGTKRVTDAFLPLIQRGGRIIHVSSGAGVIFTEGSQPERRLELTLPKATVAHVSKVADEFVAIAKTQSRDFAAHGFFAGPFIGYYFSKALLNLLTIAQSNYYTNHVVVAVHPGMIDTDMANEFASTVGKKANELGAKPVQSGTVAILRLLFEGGLESGSYYDSLGNKAPFDKLLEARPGSSAAAPSE